jgi:hypothetical protein
MTVYYDTRGDEEFAAALAEDIRRCNEGICPFRRPGGISWIRSDGAGEPQRLRVGVT